ncbi:MAG: MtnX-like HAD-IB family phosphatase [Magnetococcales bacterium]|nr:MtnX-like HAD-IB family phosphatase [Magnetococcales bacterium]
MPFRIICDFDGTIARKDVTDSLLEAFALPEWRLWETEWQAGRLGSRACMERQIGLLRASLEDLDDHLDRIDIDPGFARFVDHAQRLGCDLLVVSDGIDYAIQRILHRHGLGFLPVIANHLERVGQDRYRLSFPHAHTLCSAAAGTCKCHVARNHASSGRRHLLVGDGASDFCAAAQVDLVFAKDKLLRHCLERGLPHVPFVRFTRATWLLGALAQKKGLASSLTHGVTSDMLPGHAGQAATNFGS